MQLELSEFLEPPISIGRRKIFKTKANFEKLDALLDVPEGYFTENEISSLYRQLNEPNQEKALNYVQDLNYQSKQSHQHCQLDTKICL